MFSQNFKFVTVVLLLLLSGCGQPALPLLEKSDVIVAFGDSLTAGYGVKKGQDYPAVLSQLSGYKVVNVGVSGETSSQGLERIEAILDLHQPKLVILMEGGNDVLQKVPVVKIENNLNRMIDLIEARGASVLLIGMPEKRLFGDTLELYYDIAESRQIPLEDDMVASLLARPSMKSDYVHFNAKGYAALAEAIYEVLIESGAIEKP